MVCCRMVPKNGPASSQQLKFLQSLFPSPKEGWWPQTHHWSEASESLGGSVELKDAYTDSFYHRPFLRFTITTYQFTVLPFGQSLVRQLLIWEQRNLCSLNAVNILGSLHQGVDMLSWGGISLGEWRLHSQTVQMIWDFFRKAVVDHFASLSNIFSKELSI